jgi:CubicO group peptidase (beta-lactamase class C family)
MMADVASDVAGRAQGPPRRPDLSAARAVLATSVRRGELPCAVFGVADRAGVIGLEAVSGAQDRVTGRSIFFLASVTKPIVATAVMRYVDEGRLDLDVPVARILPAFVGHGREAVTPRHILTHSSGLPDLDIEDLLRRRPSFEGVLEQALQTVPESAPGTRVRYASSPWVLLAEMMSRLSGMRVAELLRARLTGPLGMPDTTFDPRHARSRVVQLRGMRIRNRVVGELLLRFMARATLPGGGMFGTVPGLLRLGRALLPDQPDGPRDARAHAAGEADRVLTRRAIDEMTRLQTAGLTETLRDGTTREARFALGWAKPRPGMPDVPSAFTHGGASGGRLWVDPRNGLVFAFLTNLWAAPDEPAFRVLEAVYEAVGGATGAVVEREPAGTARAR